jgi:hypothetical protein
MFNQLQSYRYRRYPSACTGGTWFLRVFAVIVIVHHEEYLHVGVETKRDIDAIDRQCSSVSGSQK